MLQENAQAAACRRRRVQRLKKCIVWMLLMAVTVPVVLCVALMIRLQSMNGTIEQLSVQLGALGSTVAAQQEQLAELTGEWKSFGQGSPQDGGAGRELTGQRLETAVSEEAQDGQEAAHRVYLTFDDGPSSYTEDILDILDRYEVKATFFVVGKETDSAKEALREIVNRGHTLGMHSYSHKYSELYASVEAFSEDFVRLQDYLEEVTGVRSTVYRFPGGSSNTVSSLNMGEFADYLDSRDVTFFDWNISSGDGGSVLCPVETLVKNATAGIAENTTSVILLHDSADKRTTVEALPIIIENILAMEDTVILPITEDTVPVQHITRQAEEKVLPN